MMVVRPRRSRPIFAPRPRRLRRALAFAGFLVATFAVVAALVWTVARLGSDDRMPDESGEHDHPPADVRSTP